MPTPVPPRRPARSARTRPRSRPPLTIRRSPTGYVVEDPALTRLAGLGPLPLPFTPEASGDEVVAHLQRLNPHREVRFEDDAEPVDSPPVPSPPSP